MNGYPEKYQQLIDAQTWAFIARTAEFYPPETATFSIDKQRAIYDEMCQEFHTGYPDGVTATDRSIDAGDRAISIREYTCGGGAAHVLYFHGGGFVVGGLDSHDDVCAEICARTGFDVTSVDYRLAPEHVFPQDFEDALAGFDHVAAKGKPVVLAGDSAGGNLCAAVAGAARGRRDAPIGQVLIYPGLGSDFDAGTFVEHEFAPMLSKADTLFYKTIRTGGSQDLLADPRCIPLLDTDFSELPDTVVISAECDPLSGDGDIYCRKLSDAGVKAHWVNEAGLVHGYLRARHTVDRARESFSRIVDAIAVLGRGDWPY